MNQNRGTSRLFQWTWIGLVLFAIHSGEIHSNPVLAEKYRQASQKQGDLVLRKAQEFYNDRMYEQCIHELNSFSLVYPWHPKKMSAWSLMSLSYQKLGNYRSSADMDLAVYMEHPTSKEGNLAYLRAGRSFVKIGDFEMAKRVFTELRDSSFFPEIAQEADLELRQWSVLSGNFRQIEENLEK